MNGLVAFLLMVAGFMLGFFTAAMMAIAKRADGDE